MIEWDEYYIEDILLENNFDKRNQINSSEIKNEGYYVVIDQGQDFIAGYSNERDKLYIPETPVIIFGDHTRIFKYVDFPFIVGADGTKILRPNPKLFDPKFFYFYSLIFKIPNRGYNRHYKLLKEQKYLKPSLPEQKKIAHILSKIQQAIEVQEKLIKTTQELKKALMQKLFTEGLNGEPQKQTEIGLIPESWEAKEFSDYLLLQRGKDLPKYNFEEGNIPVAGSNGIIGYHSMGFVNPPSITVGRSGSCGIVTFYDNIFWAHNTVLYAKDFKGNYPLFVYYHLQFIDLSKFKSGVSVPTLNRNSFSSLKISVPMHEEQIEIASNLNTIDLKLSQLDKVINEFLELFSSMLNKLMTGQIRVKGIEFEIEETLEKVTTKNGI